MLIEERSIEQAELERFVREAHERICPYSHATRANVPVTLEVIGKEASAMTDNRNEPSQLRRT